jgi:hypothetical protein
MLNDSELLEETQKNELSHLYEFITINTDYLIYTNLLLLIPIFYFLFNIKTETPNTEYLLVAMLFFVMYFSRQFWKNPIKHSRTHIIDGIVAKITMVIFIPYTLYKFSNSSVYLLSYCLILFAIATSFYLSNKYSNEEWCCSKHLICHGLFHIFCFIGTFFAFLPVINYNSRGEEGKDTNEYRPYSIQYHT